jgi:hypothetical protein
MVLVAVSADQFLGSDISSLGRYMLEFTLENSSKIARGRVGINSNKRYGYSKVHVSVDDTSNNMLSQHLRSRGGLHLEAVPAHAGQVPLHKFYTLRVCLGRVMSEEAVVPSELRLWARAAPVMAGCVSTKRSESIQWRSMRTVSSPWDSVGSAWGLKHQIWRVRQGQRVQVRKTTAKRTVKTSEKHSS